jgi:hypothetical protein
VDQFTTRLLGLGFSVSFGFLGWQFWKGNSLCFVFYQLRDTSRY